MDFGPSFYNQSSLLSINIMIVDDDPTVLKIMSRQIEKSKYKDPSVMEIRVITEKGPMEALSTLQVQRNNIDLIITDYHMPVMNGLQLKNQITQDFGNLPILVMSVDKEKEQESLTSGALAFFPKPIKETDLPRIYEFALTYKRNGGKSIMSSAQPDHQVTNVSIPKQMNLLPDPQANVVKTKKRNSDSRKNQNKVGPSDDGESQSLPAKKAKLVWTRPLHNKFVQAIKHISLEKAVPKRILELMNEPNLTRENVASHLQKYRVVLKKVQDQSMEKIASISSDQGKDINQPSFNHSTPPTSCLDASLSDRSFNTKFGYGLGQSRLLSKTPEPVRFNQMPNYMNWSSIYGPNCIGSGSNFTLPIQNNLFPPNQPSQNVERSYLFEPSLMNTKMDQTSQGFGFGLLGPNSNNFNNDMMGSYGSSASNQPGSSHFSYGSIETFLNNENPQPHASATTQPDYELPQVNNDMMNSYGIFASNQPGSNHFSYGIQSLLNNENGNACNPQPHASAQPNYELPQMDNLYSDLDQTNELLYNSGLDQQQQGEDASTNFDLPEEFFTELDQIPPLEDLVDLISPNTDQSQFYGETSNAFAAIETNPPISDMNPSQSHFNGDLSNIFSATETNPPTFNVIPDQNQFDEETSNILANPSIFNMNPNQNQEQDDDVSGFIQWSSWEPQELLDDGLTSLFK